MSQMPFPNNRRLIPLLLQQFGEGQKPVVHGGRQGGYAVYMVVGAGQNRRTAGGTDRVYAETVVETHTPLGYAIEMGRSVDPASVTAHGMGRVIVGHDEQYVWTRVAHGASPVSIHMILVAGRSVRLWGRNARLPSRLGAGHPISDRKSMYCV